MGLIKGFSNIIRNVASSALRNVAPRAADMLRNVAQRGISSVFEAGARGIQNTLGRIPLLGNFVNGLVQKYAPRLQDAAMRWANGNIDQMLSRIVQQPTSRFVPGAGDMTLPSMSNDPRLQAFLQNFAGPNTSSYFPQMGGPQTGSYASTGAPNSIFAPSSPAYQNQVTGRGGPAGGFAAYPQPPADPTDLNAMNRYQQDMLRYNAQKDMLQNDFSLRSSMLASFKDMFRTFSQNLR